jgi:hypothetical protein
LVWKTELDGFRRKAARRVEAKDGNAKLSFADNQIGLPQKASNKNFAKMGHHIGYLTLETKFCKLAIEWL